MNRPSYDEYEEVESPFAARSTDKANSRERLRTRKNVFNRPFATEATSAPLIVETKSTRRSIGRADDYEMLEHRSSELAETEIDYLEEDEEEEVETRPATRPSTKKNTKTKKNLLPKIAWSVVGLLVLRLICMDRGVWDYFATEGDIREKQSELRSIQQENKSLQTEITRIKVDKNYQRHLAKDHLGVIAADEFLVLFAGESDDSSQADKDKNQI
ncbi:MAG: septum formation initiator family protein [Bdellovibrionales bacterium]|nr:septum formation initiator family protein [Bdellovibrionales bacterium]